MIPGFELGFLYLIGTGGVLDHIWNWYCRRQARLHIITCWRLVADNPARIPLDTVTMYDVLDVLEAKLDLIRRTQMSTKLSLPSPDSRGKMPLE